MTDDLINISLDRELAESLVKHLVSGMDMDEEHLQDISRRLDEAEYQMSLDTLPPVVRNAWKSVASDLREELDRGQTQYDTCHHIVTMLSDALNHTKD